MIRSCYVLLQGYRLRIALFSKFLPALGILVLVCPSAFSDTSNELGSKWLPDKIGVARAFNKVEITPSDDAGANDYEKEFAGTRSYRSSKGQSFIVTLVKTRTDRGAYALFSSELQKLYPDRAMLTGLGTAAVSESSGRLLVYKGVTFITITDESRVKNSEQLISFARLVVEPLDNGDGEIPVLVKHLPNWETAIQNSIYVISLPSLQTAAGQRPVLDAISFTGGTEAVTASYDRSRLVIVEHTTPQLATENEARVNARLSELRQNVQAVPTAFRRVGNYSVFVFDAPDETTATQLIDKIAYEQVVQWLGDNPNWLIRAEREYRRTTGGLILAVFKASGLSLLICLGIGGIFGGIVFRRRRAKQAFKEAYSDAGGMLRLNIDEMTPEIDPSRLLSKGDR